MSHVFHHDRHALHGVTVVLETASGDTYLGRFDSEDELGVHLLDVGKHSGGTDRDEYIRRSMRFGIRVEQKHVVLPTASVAKITPLGEVSV
jgi:hypothetical protein